MLIEVVVEAFTLLPGVSRLSSTTSLESRECAFTRFRLLL